MIKERPILFSASAVMRDDYCGFVPVDGDITNA